MQKKWMMEHYFRNRELLKKKALERYYKKKNENRDI